MYAYCVFCNTLKRSQLTEAIQQLLGVEVLIPKISRGSGSRAKPMKSSTITCPATSLYMPTCH